MTRNSLPTAAACYITQMAIRKLPIHLSPTVVMVTLFALVYLTLMIRLWDDSESEAESDRSEKVSEEQTTYGTFTKLQNSPPKDCTDPDVVAVLSATNFYEVCVVLYSYSSMYSTHVRWSLCSTTTLQTAAMTTCLSPHLLITC